jgi:predicted kinase
MAAPIVIFDPAANREYPPGTPRLAIPVGLPAAGKSTLARKARNGLPVGRDGVRGMLGCMPVGTPEQEAAITRIVDASVRTLLTSGWDVTVVLDATNLQPGCIAHGIALAEAAGAPWEIWDLTGVGPEECVRRNAARMAAGGRDVPERVIWGMAGQWLASARAEIAAIRAERVVVPEGVLT